DVGGAIGRRSALRLNELAGNGDIDGANQIGGKDKTVGQNADKQQVLGRVVSRDLLRHFPDSALNLLRADQHGRWHVLGPPWGIGQRNTYFTNSCTFTKRLSSHLSRGFSSFRTHNSCPSAVTTGQFRLSSGERCSAESNS